MTKVGKGDEVNANELFKNKRKPAFHWFVLALLAFTIIDYLCLRGTTKSPAESRAIAGIC
jgi:hypothetical protein